MRLIENLKIGLKLRYATMGFVVWVFGIIECPAQSPKPLKSAETDAKPAQIDFSRFHGIGLIDKLGPNWFPPCKHRESDFQFAKDNGFNFLRLPADYRFLTKDSDPAALDEGKMAEFDQAVAWGKKYGQHICLNFFSVPGYSINEPKQTPSLWSDVGSQEIFCGYWKQLAERYKAVPPAELSFNLLNEPAWDVPEKEYGAVMRRAIETIQAVDPSRPILVDGLNCGRKPVMSLIDIPGLVQTMHFYEPSSFTHYQAHWVDGKHNTPPPRQWPLPRITHHLFGPEQEKFSPLVLRGVFPPEARIEVVIASVSASPDKPLTLALTMGGRSAGVQVFQPDESRPEWQQSTSLGAGGLKEYRLDRSVVFRLPPGCDYTELVIKEGDRLSFRSIRLFAGTNSDPVAVLYPTSTLWDAQVCEVVFDNKNGFVVGGTYNRNWIAQEAIGPWEPLLKKGGIVMVQEFGCISKVPHKAALSYVEDCLAVWNEHRIGWALYSLRGDMGFVDSQRSDAQMDHMQDGSLLDTQYLQVLRRNMASPRQAQSSSTERQPSLRIPEVASQ